MQKMKRPHRKKASAVREVAHLEDIPNIGPAISADLRKLGITSPDDLPGRDPYAMYNELCRITGKRHDPCLHHDESSSSDFLLRLLNLTMLSAFAPPPWKAKRTGVGFFGLYLGGMWTR